MGQLQTELLAHHVCHAVGLWTSSCMHAHDLLSCFLPWGCCSEEPKPEDAPVEEAAAEEAAAEPEAPVEEEKVRSWASWELVHGGVWICTLHNATSTNGLAKLKRAFEGGAFGRPPCSRPNVRGH